MILQCAYQGSSLRRAVAAIGLPLSLIKTELETISPVYAANRKVLTTIPPIFYVLSGSPVECLTDTSTEKTGLCTLTFDMKTMSKSCNETPPVDALDINMSLGLSYPDDRQFTAQVFSLVFVCNRWWWHDQVQD